MTAEFENQSDEESERVLEGRKIAILCTDGVEQSELLEPLRALRAAGAEVALVSPAEHEVQAMKHDEKGERVPVDVPLAQADADEFSALVLPGGVANPDRLRMNTEAVAFVRAFVEDEKPIAAICHGPWMLIEAGAVRGKAVTSWPSLKTDLKNAGAMWSDVPVAVSEGLVTSRKPADLPDFNREVIKMFARASRISAKRPTPSVAPSAQI